MSLRTLSHRRLHWEEEVLLLFTDVPGIVRDTLWWQLSFNRMNFHFIDEAPRGLPVPVGDVKLGPKVRVRFAFPCYFSKDTSILRFPCTLTPSPK